MKNAFEEVHRLSDKYHWKEGSAQKVALHAAIGEITAQLDISSRYDADVFMSKINEADQPLSRLSDGIHEHRIGCRDKEIFELIRKSLREKKILIE